MSTVMDIENSSPAQDASSVVRSTDPVRRGQEAWSRLATREKHTWEDWILVGEALRVGRHQAMRQAGTNTPSGKRYNGIFGEWLQETGFDAVDKGARSRLFDCLENLDQINNWRDALPFGRRLELNHPNTVFRTWRSATTRDKTTALSPMAALKAEIVRLEEANDRLQRAGDDLFARKDSAADIARVLADRLLLLSPAKARQIIDMLPDVFASLRAQGDAASEPRRQRKGKQQHEGRA
jgi:hypothetical protein